MKALDLNDALLRGESLVDILTTQIDLSQTIAQKLDEEAVLYPARSARRKTVLALAQEKYAFTRGLREARSVAQVYEAMKQDKPIEEA